MSYRSVILLLCIIRPSFAAIVKFLPSTSFNLPINFKDGKLPCSRETVIFPETLLASVRLESETSVTGFVLPKDGDIFIADGTITLGADESDVNCTQEGNVYYMENAVTSWSQPDIWSSSRFNDATPDAERVPCFDDIVDFPSDAEFSLTLPDQIQYVSGVKFGNYTGLTLRNFVEYIDKVKPEQTFVHNDFLFFGLRFKQEQCMSRAGCQCQKHPLKINCQTKYCAVPTCLDPIKPEGHCCKICGGVIAFDIDESFDIMIFKELVDEIVKSYGDDSLVYHIGRLPKDKIQLVVVNEREYSGLSAEVVNTINRQMKKHWVTGAKYVDISGSPIDQSGLGLKIFFSMFFLVILTMGGVYVYYYKLAEVLEVRVPILHRNTHGVFSRFQTRTDSVVCLTRRDSETPLGLSSGTAFRNPLYDSTRQRVKVTETDTDE